MTRAPNSVLTILASDTSIARAMGTSRQRMLTMLLLSLPNDALDLIGWYRREIISGRFSPDPTIVFSLFRSLDRRGKIDLATTFCGSSLDTHNFVKLMSLVYRTCSPKGLERDYLAQTVSRHASVYWHISAPAFEKLVRQLLMSRRAGDRMHGVLCLESLSDMRSDLCLRLAQLVRDPLPYVRSNAWYGASTLLYRGRLSAAVQQQLLRYSLAALNDRDKFVRRNARLFRRRSRARAPVAHGNPRFQRRWEPGHDGITVGMVGV